MAQASLGENEEFCWTEDGSQQPLLVDLKAVSASEERVSFMRIRIGLRPYPSPYQAIEKKKSTQPSRATTMLTDPSSFLQQLALQAQVLANLQWLCEFQVLACIPLDGSVAFEEVADISNVPVDQLRRVTRLMMTAGFLCETDNGQVAHTPLSASFVTEPALLDAAMFLAQTAVPAALKMPMNVQQVALSDSPHRLAAHAEAAAAAAATQSRMGGFGETWNFDTSQPRTQRQFAAYLTHGILDESSAIEEVLKLVDWAALGSATVVDVNPPSIAAAATLAALAPAVQFVVQRTSSQHDAHGNRVSASDGAGGHSWLTYNMPPSVSRRISVQPRQSAPSQAVPGAAIYILRLTSPSPLLPWPTVRSHSLLELRAHLQVLRVQPKSRLLLTALVIPNPGTVDRGAEAMVCVRDLSLLQLSNDRLPSRDDIIGLIMTIRDSGGSLVVSNEIHSHDCAAIAFEIRYQPYDDKAR